MAGNVIRQDVVQIVFDVDDSPLGKITKEVQKMQSTVGKAVGKSENKFDDLAQEVQKAQKELKQATNAGKKFTDAVKSIGKATLNKLQSGLTKIKTGFEKGVAAGKKLLLSVKKIDKEKFKQINTGINNLTKKLGSGLVNGAKKAAKAIAAIGVAAGAGIFKLTDMASDLSETINKVDVSFGDSSAEVKKWSKNSIKDMGMAQQTALDMAALFGDMGTGMGISQKDAANMSMELTQLGADLASFKNMGIDEVTTALNGVFTGETEGLKRIGVVMTQANLEAFALSQGIKKPMKEMSESEKVMLRYEYLLSKTKNAQGDFARTGGGFANQLRMAKEQLKQIGTTVGGVFIKSFEKGLKKVNDFATGLNEKLSEVLSDGFQFGDVAKIAPMLGSVGTAIQKIADKIRSITSNEEKMGKIRAVFSAIKDAAGNVAAFIGKCASKITDFVTSSGFLDTVKSVVEGISKAFAFVGDNLDVIMEVVIPLAAAIGTVVIAIKAISAAMAVWNAIQWVLNSGLLACPITWIVLAIAALVAIIVVLVRHWDKVKEVAINCWNKIKEIWGKVKDWFNENVIQPVVGFFSRMWDGIKNAFTKAFNWVKENIVAIVLFIINPFAGVFKYLYDHCEGFRNFVDKVVSSIKGFFASIGEWIYTKVIQPVVNFFKGLGTALLVIVLGIVGLICQGFLKIANWVNEKVIQPIVNFFVSLWNKIVQIATSIWNGIKAVWGAISGWVNEKIIQPVVGFFTNLWTRIKEIVTNIWTGICSIWGKISGWVNNNVIVPIKDFFTGLWSKIKEIASNIKNSIVEAFQSAWEKVTGVWNGIKDFFKGIWEGLKDTGSALKDSLVSIWKDAVKAIAKPVNKLIGGANWVLEKLGAEKRIAEWQPYARGTDGHPGGNAIVNDGRGAEMVQMPNGYTFIPKGRNVMLPNAPAGMKVLDAERTAKVMGKSRPTFNYVGGIGDWEIWDFFDNAKGLAGKVIEKFVSFDGMTGYALDAGKAMISKAKDSVVSWIKKQFGLFGGKGLADYNASKGVEQWRSTVIQALKMEGLYSAANVKRTLFQMQTESGGNPRAVNNWDVNAKNGTPSKGLMQVIDPTFKAYARTGYNSNIYDPLSNILASVRYAVARYGSLESAYRGVGYANGVGQIVLPAYTPGSSVSTTNNTSTNNSHYAPSFTLNMSGTVDRTTERTIKKWVKEALEDMFESISRTSPCVTEV